MSYERQCRRGERCAARHDWNGPAPTDRAVCDRDVEELSRVLREFGGRDGLLVQLHLAKQAVLAGRGLSERTSGGEAVAPLPFDAHVDELANLVVGTVVEWARLVAEVAGCPAPPPGHHYAGRALNIAIATLRPRLSALIALPSLAVTRGGEPVTMDGGDAALELFDLHHRCRATLGRTLKVVRMPDPCTATVIDHDGTERKCGVRALLRYDGHDGVRCGACGNETELDDHEPTQESA